MPSIKTHTITRDGSRRNHHIHDLSNRRCPGASLNPQSHRRASGGLIKPQLGHFIASGSIEYRSFGTQDPPSFAAETHAAIS
jgi:hypothetical protein